MHSLPLRILHIVTDMNIGGIETMLMNCHRNIDRSKIQFDYLVHRKEKAAYDDEITKLGGKIYRLPSFNPFNLKYRNELNIFFSQHSEYQIVQSHINALSALPLFYAMKNKIPWRIAHSHAATKFSISAKNIVKAYYKNKLPKYANYNFACSNKAGEWLFGKNNFLIFRNAINSKNYIFNPDTRANFRKSLNVSNELVVGNVGSFYPLKNHDFIIDIFYEIINKGINAKLLLIGKGPNEERIKTKVKSLHLQDKVKFLGLRNDVNNLLQAMDVFVLPSLSEGLGIVAIEAQAAGLPCIVSDAIPNECMITDYIKNFSLSKTPSNWADLVIKESTKPRVNTYNELVKANYDIKNNVKYWEAFYLDLLT